MIRRVWSRMPRAWVRLPRAVDALPSVQKGTTLVELSLVLPFVLLLILGAADLGLALRTQTALSQMTEQAAQYVLDHPYTAATNPSVAITTQQIATYIQQLDPSHFSDITSSDISISYQAAGLYTSSTDSTPTALEAIISVSYPYKVLIPIGSRLNYGALHNGALYLGATASTIIAPTAPALTIQGSKLCWARSTNAVGTTVPLTYYIYGVTSTGATTLLYNTPTPTTSSTDCPANKSGTYSSYQVVAEEPNGLYSSAGTA